MKVAENEPGAYPDCSKVGDATPSKASASEANDRNEARAMKTVASARSFAFVFMLFGFFRRREVETPFEEEEREGYESKEETDRDRSHHYKETKGVLVEVVYSGVILISEFHISGFSVDVIGVKRAGSSRACKPGNGSGRAIYCGKNAVTERRCEGCPGKGEKCPA